MDNKVKTNKKKILDKRILNCKKCPGLNIPKETMSAPGYGSFNAELFVIGQSLHSYNLKTPNQQIPFIGNKYNINDSGILLYDILEKAGYSFKYYNLFVTNLIHCHPPNNRKSKLEEINNCKSYLMKELSLIKPSIILLLGADVRNYFRFTPIKKGFVSLKSNNILPGTIKYFILAYHPSYILRYGLQFKNIYMKQLIKKLKKVKKIIKQ
ncbi:MAG TPA: hypothetical protein ENG87_01180 [Candidatus Pacearchaeota archaeon]|nr:hypothetical protein [Candidatus Pacearchaeota archaeon]